MTVLRAGDIDQFLSRPDPRRPIVLVYGPDSGLVSERIAMLVRAAAGENTDPFSIVPLEGDAIAGDPGLLVDEAQTFGLFGGRRVIRVRAGGKNFSAAVETLLSNPPEATILIEAGELRPSSPLRALCEKSSAAAVIPCYADNAAGLSKLIERAVADAGLRITPEAREELAALLGGDRLASRAEIEKLVLYAKEGTINVEDVRAVIADASALELDDVMDFAAVGEAEQAVAALNRAYAAGTLPATVLSTAARHVATLHRLRLAVDNGESVSAAVKGARPPVFFRRQPKFERALSRFSSDVLMREIVAISDASLAARQNSELAEAIAERAILRLAKSGKQPGRSIPNRP